MGYIFHEVFYWSFKKYMASGINLLIDSITNQIIYHRAKQRFYTEKKKETRNE